MQLEAFTWSHDIAGPMTTSTIASPALVSAHRISTLQKMAASTSESTRCLVKPFRNVSAIPCHLAKKKMCFRVKYSKFYISKMTNCLAIWFDILQERVRKRCGKQKATREEYCSFWYVYTHSSLVASYTYVQIVNFSCEADSSSVE